MSARRVLLVDLDGTLTDNFPGIARSIRHALAALGAPDVDMEMLRPCVGPPLRASFARLLDTDDSASIECAIGHYRARYADVGWQENVPYDGIAEALATLHDNGAPMFLCTSKPQPFAERIIAKFELGRYFDRIYGVDLDGALDDKATLVAHVVAVEKHDAQRCVMIGDREHDVRAARKNAARAIGVLWGYGSRDELEAAGAHAIATAPHDLARVVDSLPLQ